MQQERTKNDIIIGVIGCGYVGAPLLFALSKYFQVIGFDKSSDRVRNLKDGIDQTNELTVDQLAGRNDIQFSVDIKDLSSCNVYIITVPTPVKENNVPDLSFLKTACMELSKILECGDTIVFESTVFPGCTEEICIPLIEETSGLKYNQDFYVGYSPERINPGDKKNTISSVVKVIAGGNKTTLDLLYKIYSKIVSAGVYCAENIKTAEAAKIIENTQRDVNIALINEFAMLFSKMGLDTNQVLAAANTKWNFLSFTPGLVGGHCIGVDPYYLAYKARELDFDPKMILSGRKTNEEVLNFITKKIEAAIDKQHRDNAKILILGATFKENVPDFRNSKSLELARQLQLIGFNVEIHDPYLVGNKNLENEFDIVNEYRGRKYDLVVVTVGHDEYKNMPIEEVRTLLNIDGKIFDLKGIYPLNEVEFRL